MAVDLGKEIGPLPLGAWIVVVGAGLGIAYYTKQHSGAPTIVTDTSGDPGVGTGAVGGWSATTPGGGTGQPTITNNEEWARAAINYLIAEGYDANVADSAIRKYLSGDKQSVQEYTLTGLALRKLGSPPVPLPPGGGTDTADPGVDASLAITDLRVIDVQRDSFTIAWSPVKGAVWYEHFLRDDGSSTGGWMLNTTTRKIGGLSPGKHYNVLVIAYNGIGSRRGPDATVDVVTAP
jgi:hypothetical protein